MRADCPRKKALVCHTYPARKINRVPNTREKGDSEGQTIAISRKLDTHRSVGQFKIVLDLPSYPDAGIEATGSRIEVS